MEVGLTGCRSRVVEACFWVLFLVQSLPAVRPFSAPQGNHAGGKKKKKMDKRTKTEKKAFKQKNNIKEEEIT